MWFLVAHTGPMWVDFVNSKFLLQTLKQVTYDIYFEKIHITHSLIQSCTQNLALKSPFQILLMRKNVIGSVALLRLEQLLCAEPSVSWRAHVGAATCD